MEAITAALGQEIEMANKWLKWQLKRFDFFFLFYLLQVILLFLSPSFQRCNEPRYKIEDGQAAGFSEKASVNGNCQCKD